MTNLISDHNLGFALEIGMDDRVRGIVGRIYKSEMVQSLIQFEENNPWHDHENVLRHIETVFANLQILLRFEFVDEILVRRKYLDYMEQVIMGSEWIKRKEALILACALHDISKGQKRPKGDTVAPGRNYLFEKEDGTTSGKGHELASAVIAREILLGEGLRREEIEWIAALVADHDQFSLDYCKNNLHGYQTGEMSLDVETILKDQPVRALELVLHIVADEWGASVSQWKSEYLLKLASTGDLA